MNSIVSDTYRNMRHESLNFNRTRELLGTPAVDKHIYEYIQTLRGEVEDPSDWQRCKEHARAELDSFNENTHVDLVRKLLPYLREQTASHSIGHAMREIPKLALILDSYGEGEIDDVDAITGILASSFHDCGVAITDRYREYERLNGHAEIGAWLFGNIAKDLNAPHMVKLVQFCIAAHTNYQNPHEVLVGNKKYTRKPYDARHKKALYIARASDRLDIISPTIAVRHLLGMFGTNHEIGDILDPASENPMSMIMQTKKLTASLSDQHYTQGDIPFVTKTLEKNAEYLAAFIDLVNDNLEGSTYKRGALRDFTNLCYLLEPGRDIDQKVERLNSEFFTLEADIQKAWSHAFSGLVHDIYPAYFASIRERVAQVASQDANSPVGGIVSNLHRVSSRLLSLTDPSIASSMPLSREKGLALYEEALNYF